MRVFNLGLRFMLELAALAALAYGGWHTPGPTWSRIALAVALPLLAAVVWGQWVAPKARHPMPDPQRLAPEWAVFGGATVSLALTGHPILAAVLAALAALNRFALWRLRTETDGTAI
ncbi:YrdB family protein [Micromonosporaceae bacterium Da 78-11]